MSGGSVGSGAGGEPGSGAGGEPGSGSSGIGGTDDPEAVLRESMGDYDREISREREAMASSGQGTAGGADGTGDMIGGASGGSMTTIPNMSGGAGSGGGMAGGAETGGGAGGGGSGGGDQPGGGSEEGSAEGSEGRAAAKVEIPEDIAEVTGSEDQVARQIREAAESTEDPRIREALWDEYRRHMGIASK